MKPTNTKIEMLKGYYNFVLEMIEIHKSLLKDTNKLASTKCKLGETYIKDYIRCLEVTQNITNDLLRTLSTLNDMEDDKNIFKNLNMEN